MKTPVEIHKMAMDYASDVVKAIQCKIQKGIQYNYAIKDYIAGYEQCLKDLKNDRVQQV